MKKQKILICISLALALFMAAFGSNTVYAESLRRKPDDTLRIDVGSTAVELEIGCNNSYYAYATVRASDYVDAHMKLIVYYDDNKSHKTIESSFSQQTYGTIGYNCSSKISLIECYFTVTSADDEKTKFRTLDDL